MPRVVESKWKETDAVALETRAQAIAVWLEHSEDLIEMLGENEEIITDLRSLCGWAKSRKTDLLDQSERLWSDLKGSVEQKEV